MMVWMRMGRVYKTIWSSRAKCCACESRSVRFCVNGAGNWSSRGMLYVAVICFFVNQRRDEVWTRKQKSRVRVKSPK
jgi:hypothetical protein